jgi:hypothetical protein
MKVGRTMIEGIEILKELPLFRHYKRLYLDPIAKASILEGLNLSPVKSINVEMEWMKAKLGSTTKSPDIKSIQRVLIRELGVKVKVRIRCGTKYFIRLVE